MPLPWRAWRAWASASCGRARKPDVSFNQMMTFP
jgi:hypothetical protein